MISEIVGLLGTSAVGAIFGQVASFFSARQEAKIQKEKQDHEKTMALSGNYKEFVQTLQGPDGEGSSYSSTIEWVIWMLAVTVCFCTIWCFLYPDIIILTLNPDEAPRKFNFLFGLFSYERTSNKVISISTGGVGFRLIYAQVFIVSSVVSGVVSKKIR